MPARTFLHRLRAISSTSFHCAAAEFLDPCHGLVGRLVGFLLSKRGKSYCGYDVDPRTYEGVRDLGNDLLPYAPKNKSFETYLQPFEQCHAATRRFRLSH